MSWHTNAFFSCKIPESRISGHDSFKWKRIKRLTEEAKLVDEAAVTASRVKKKGKGARVFVPQVTKVEVKQRKDEVDYQQVSRCKYKPFYLQ